MRGRTGWHRRTVMPTVSQTLVQALGAQGVTRVFCVPGESYLAVLDALYDALRSGHVAAAGLDVFPQEPPVSTPRLVEAWRNNEDWLAGRLVLSPHAAFYSEAAYRDMRTFSAEILMEYLVAGNLRNNVNPGWNSKVA